MSLFKAREWWQTQCGSGEEFDGGCLCVANFDGEGSGEGAFRNLCICYKYCVKIQYK